MKESDFEIGRRYRHRNGIYEVLRRERERLVVRFDSGEERTLDAEIAARISSNIEIEERTQLPGGLHESQLQDFSWTLGAICKTGFLSAEVPPQSESGFQSDYRAVAGNVDFNTLEGYFPISEGGYNKWGCELRIEFPEMMLSNSRFVVPVGVNVVSGHSPGIARINNNGFWWHLVNQLGFRLGPKQNTGVIERNLPLNIREAFRGGINYEE